MVAEAALSLAFDNQLSQPHQNGDAGEVINHTSSITMDSGMYKPLAGGVLTPASALGVQYAKRLEKYGITLSLL